MQYRSTGQHFGQVRRLLLPAVAALCAGCSGVKETPAANRDSPVVATPMEETPCPPPDSGERSILGKIGPVPEYHDCQKLATGSPAVYGPLVGIFVTEHFVRDSAPRAPRAAESSPDENLFPKALIHNFGPQEYHAGDLWFPVGYSCLQVFVASGEWRARITFVGASPDDCVKPPAGAKPVVTLAASHPPRPKDPLSFSDYPAVARWEWDPVALRHYIGIKCGDNWCEVGGSGEPAPLPDEVPVFTPLPVASAPASGGPKYPKRVHEVKGWYDEQFLAETGPWRPAVHARLYPHPQLEQVKLADFEDWVTSAYVWLSAPSSKYEKTFGLRQGLNEIALCQGTNCTGASESSGCVASPANTKPNGETARVWYARIRPMNDTDSKKTKYRCVTKQQHPDVAIPGTARWRWSDDDEKIWIRCTNGCCTVS